MAGSALSDLISLYRFPPGRRIYALRRTHALLPDGDPVRSKIDRASSRGLTRPSVRSHPGPPSTQPPRDPRSNR